MPCCTTWTRRSWRSIFRVPPRSLRLPVSGRPAQPEDHDLHLRGVWPKLDSSTRPPAARDGAAACWLGEDAGRAGLFCPVRKGLDLPLTRRRRIICRAYNVIDSDGHILEPLTLWNDYMDPGWTRGSAITPQTRHRQGRQGTPSGRGADPRHPAGYGRHRWVGARQGVVSAEPMSYEEGRPGAFDPH